MTTEVTIIALVTCFVVGVLVGIVVGTSQLPKN